MTELMIQILETKESDEQAVEKIFRYLEV